MQVLHSFLSLVDAGFAFILIQVCILFCFVFDKYRILFVLLLIHCCILFVICLHMLILVVFSYLFVCLF